VAGKQRLPLRGLTKCSGMIVYWGFFLRISCFHLVSELRESRIHSGSSEAFSGPLVLSPLEEFGLDILPILSDPTVDCTRLEADCELVTLVSIIFRALTQGDDEGESSLYLDQTLVKLTRAPWRETHG
jgi:hypothetical protein